MDIQREILDTLQQLEATDNAEKVICELARYRCKSLFIARAAGEDREAQVQDAREELLKRLRALLSSPHV